MLSTRLMLCALASTLVALSSMTEGAIELEHISTIYIPYSYLSSARYDIDSDAVEQVAYDAAEGYAYVIGDDYLQIVDYDNVTNPEIVHKQPLLHRANDIAHCGRFVAYLIQGDDSQESGTIYVYEKYNRETGEFTQIYERIINSQPEMLTFTPDCRKILTADEGTAGDDAREENFLNPEGMVSIIKINGDFASPTFDYVSVNFNDFDDRRQKYLDLGVRFPYNGRYTNYTEQTLSESVEPEYIAINPRDNVAYINLQENNAIAVLDLSTESIVEIVPLGTKKWANLNLDASDRDDDDQLASTVSQTLREALNDDLRLGRLEFSVTDGLSKTEEGKIEELFFFGGRGFSILRADHLTRVFDSGDDIERRVAEQFPMVFNSETYSDRPASDSPSDLADKRSDNRGPECETVEVGVVNGKTVLFVGVDRASVIAIYTIAANGEATFQSMHKRGGTDRTFHQLLDDRELGDLDPKDIEFVPADQSPTKKPLLMVAGTASGTLSLYHVNDDSASGGESASNLGGKSGATCISSMGLFIMSLVSIMAILLPK